MKKILIGVCLLSSLITAKPRLSWGGKASNRTYIYEGVKQMKTRDIILIGYNENSEIIIRKRFNTEGEIYQKGRGKLIIRKVG